MNRTQFFSVMARLKDVTIKPHTDNRYSTPELGVRVRRAVDSHGNDYIMVWVVAVEGVDIDGAKVALRDVENDALYDIVDVGTDKTQQRQIAFYAVPQDRLVKIEAVSPKQ